MAGMINPLKLPLLHNTEGLIFAGPGLSSIMGRVSFLYKDGPRGVMGAGGYSNKFVLIL